MQINRYLTLSLVLASVIAITGCTQGSDGLVTPPPSPIPEFQASTPTPVVTTSTPEARPQEKPPVAAPAKSLPVGSAQSSNAGNITIEARLTEVKADSILFKVSMNTHSVDLDRIDLSTLAVLIDEQGNKYNPRRWQSPPGGHHRSGDLTFPLPPTVAKGETRFVEMVIRDVAGIPERVLRWELK